MDSENVCHQPVRALLGLQHILGCRALLWEFTAGDSDWLLADTGTAIGDFLEGTIL